MVGDYLYIIVSLIFIVLSFLPAIDSQHWIFRIAEYLRIQILGIMCLLLAVGFLVGGENITIRSAILVLIILSIIHHIRIILPYLLKRKQTDIKSTNKVTILSVNVLQKNENYEALIKIIKNIKPDILLTMETNEKWETALSEIEGDFSFNHNIPKENRYGMHFYTNLEVEECKEHHLISADHPSIETTLLDKEGNKFVFWGIHPPPPSPTEKPTSKQKDAELMKLAKLIHKNIFPTIVTGDFNNVCWSKSSKMFSKMSNLEDSRIKRGIYGTFPAQVWFMRFPVDLLFHSKSIIVTKLDTLSPFGSDHLPVFSELFIHALTHIPKKNLKPEFKEEVNTIIKEGKKAAVEEND